MTFGGVPLVRVGNDFDGGYLMAKPFSETPIAYSFGIAEDVSWDKQMAGEGYQIYQYDHTISKLPEENPAFHWEKLGITGEEETRQLKNLTTLMEHNDHRETQGMVLKMDVEGYEWDVLASLPEKVLLQFDQIVLEMHGIIGIENREKIVKVLENLACTHSVVHLHPNNNGSVDYCGDLLMPDLLEVTYLRKGLHPLVRYTGMMPRAQDRPCVKRLPEIQTGFWNLPESQSTQIDEVK